MARRRVTKRKSRKVSKRKTNKSTKFAKAIQSLKRMRPNQRVVAIRHANDKFIKDMISHVKKLRTRKLSPNVRKAMKRHSTKLRFLISPKVSLQRKRHTLSQKGGFLPMLLPLLAPLAGAVAGPIINSIFKRR